MEYMCNPLAKWCGCVTMKQFALCKPQYCNPMYELYRWEMPPADMDAISNEIDTLSEVNSRQRDGEIASDAGQKDGNHTHIQFVFVL